jgi:hypothetical protein
MKYKYFVMLVLLTGFSFIRTSSEDRKKVINPDCQKICGKCKQSSNPVKDDNGVIQLSPLNPFLDFI